MNYYPPQQVGAGPARGLTQGEYGTWTRSPADGPAVTVSPQSKLPVPPIGTTERVPYLYPPGSIQAFFGRHALLFGCLMMVVAFMLFMALGAVTPIAGLEGDILVRLVIVLVMAGMFWMMGMSGEIRPTLVGIRTSLTLGLYPLLTSLFVGTVISGWGLSSYVSELLTPSGIITAVELLVMCLLIGAFEEMLTRGMLLSGLQSRLGKSSGGLYVSAYVSAVVFGALHVIPSVVLVVTGELPLTASIILQMALKTVQTGMLGVLLAAITIRTHSIWGATLVHALDDYFLMLPGYLGGGMAAIGFVRGGIPMSPLLAEETLGGYVSGDPDQAFALIVSYVIVSLCYIPYLFTAGKLIKAARLPDTGAMCEEYVAHEIEEYDNKKALVFMYPLMPLVPQWQAPAPQQMAVPYQMAQMPYWAPPATVSPTASQVAWQTMPQPMWGQQPAMRPVAQQAPMWQGHPQQVPQAPQQAGQRYPQAPLARSYPGQAPQQGYPSQPSPQFARQAPYPQPPAQQPMPRQGPYPQQVSQQTPYPQQAPRQNPYPQRPPQMSPRQPGTAPRHPDQRG